MKTIITIAAAAAALTAVSVRAESPVGHPTMLVHYDDINLGTARGQSTLDRRILMAAKTVCGAAGSFQELAQSIEQDRCVRVTVADTKTRLAAIQGQQFAAR